MTRDPDEGGDDAYDRLREDVDCGVRCPKCFASGYVEKRLHGPAFQCKFCAHQWSAWREEIAA